MLHNDEELHTVRFRPPRGMNLRNLDEHEKWFNSFLASYNKELFVTRPLFDDYDVGFLAKLSEAEAKEIQKIDGCISARREKEEPGPSLLCNIEL